VLIGVDRARRRRARDVLRRGREVDATYTLAIGTGATFTTIFRLRLGAGGLRIVSDLRKTLR